ncbi:MAG: SDR family oxidoreductase [Actinomycetota bacterium]|nr:SDR family oxidoreductase [Actinomycetota bacterium]
MILVTGATGNVGSAVVAELTAKGETVRALVRDEKRARERLGKDVELAVGDFEDAASIVRVLAGVDAVFLSSADQPKKVAHETAVIDAAHRASVRRIVKASTVGAEKGSPLPPFDWHGRIEEHLRASGIPSVVLHSFFYMTNLLGSAQPVQQMGKLFAPLGGAKIAMIDPRDTAAVGAAALTTDAYEGKTLELSGPESVTYEQVAEELSAAIGRAVEFVNIPDEAARQTFTEMGFSDWLITHFDHLFPLLRSGVVAQPTDTVRAVTGREPRSFAAWAKDHAEMFRA